MTSTQRSVLIGATLAVVVVAAAVVALLMLRPAASGGNSAEGARAPGKVVVVFAMAGEDKTVTAQIVAVVDTASGGYELQDTSATVSIPGTSYTALRDAYPFGGAKAVAAALQGGSVEADTAWVDVSPDAWLRLAASGVDVTITAPFDTFDEVTERLAAFEKGANHVAPADLRALLNGVQYLSLAERAPIMRAVAAASLRELASAPTPPQGVDTDLASAQWASFSRALSNK